MASAVLSEHAYLFLNCQLVLVKHLGGVLPRCVVTIYRKFHLAHRKAGKDDTLLQIISDNTI